MTALVDPLIYQARPRFFIDGEEQLGLSDGLFSMQVGEDCEGMASCEATFANWGVSGQGLGFLYFDRELLDFGRQLVIEAGAGTGTGRIFDGRITALEGRFLRDRPHEILILAEDRLQELRMTRRTRTFEDVRDTDIFSQIANEHGLQSEVDVNGSNHRIVAQVNQSDLAFMRERARDVDAELWVANGSLHVVARSRRNTGEAILTFGGGLLECSITADLTGQMSGFAVSGWDIATKGAIQHRADAQALAGELGVMEGGSQILERAIGARDEQVVHLAPTTSVEARTLAEAHYRRAARRFVAGNCLAEGDARLRVGTKVELRSLGRMFDGEYYVSRTCHLFDAERGFQTQFAVERPGIGG